MGILPALLLATPLFGFSLQVDPALALDPAALGVVLPLEVAAVAAPADDGDGEPTFAEQMQTRAELAQIHKALGIATWASTTMTLVLGIIQYRNLYGAFDGQSDNPCVTGDATFGQGQCSGTPWVHLSSAMLTGALYYTTFGFSLAMPDPGGLSDGDSDYARNLRTHKILRWIHFGGMAAQILLGAVVANSESFGLDRANDYRTLQRLSTVHLGLGLVTWGALTYAGTIMVF